MKKIKAVVAMTIFFVAGLYTLPAGAVTVKNGVNCAKAGATMKVGLKTYRCAKNPFLKPTRNTWTFRGCLTAYALWQSSKKQYEDWADLAKLAGAEGEKTLDQLQASITELELTMKDEACKKGF